MPLCLSLDYQFNTSLLIIHFPQDLKPLVSVSFPGTSIPIIWSFLKNGQAGRADKNPHFAFLMLDAVHHFIWLVTTWTDFSFQDDCKLTFTTCFEGKWIRTKGNSSDQPFYSSSTMRPSFSAFVLPHSAIASTTAINDCPSSVSSYSTLGGTSG